MLDTNAYTDDDSKQLSRYGPVAMVLPCTTKNSTIMFIMLNSITTDYISMVSLMGGTVIPWATPPPVTAAAGMGC